MKTLIRLLLALALPVAAMAADLPERQPVESSILHYGGNVAKAVVDTVTLMGPDGAYPFRGDFESASPLPDGNGLLADGWISVDQTVPANHWHVDTFNNPGTGKGAWCGYMAPPCDGADPAGGYGNNWRDILEFRKTVAATAHTVRVQAKLRYDCEPGYDYTTLQRRTADYANFEPVSGGQGLSWDGGPATVDVDFTFTYSAAELVGGSEIAVAFIFDSDGAWSDDDCLWVTSGAAQVDDIAVTIDGTAWTEDFEDDTIGPDWTVVSTEGFGDFARVWKGLCELDPCGGNNSNQVAFIDSNPHRLDPPPPPDSCGLANNMSGWTGWKLDNAVYSPVMPLPGGVVDGLTLAFNVYQERMANPIAGLPVYFTWAVRSTAGGDIATAPWVDRSLFYTPKPEFQRQVLPVGDLLVPGATSVQVMLRAAELGWCFGCDPAVGAPSPYFDNVRVQAYPSAGPRMVVDERRLANDGFPASGALDLVNLGANSVRFDMAANISARSHLRNDPGDSVYIDVTPRAGATLDTPVMYWTLARRNPLFDPFRTLPPNPVTGRVTRTATNVVVANRWNFDLPDTGMLFPGDVLHYYFSATDHRAGEARTSTLPADLAGYGDPTPQAYLGMYTVRCLPSLQDAGGVQPTVLFWDDSGASGVPDEWYGALRLRLREGLDYDVFTTQGPKYGLGNGLGGRATAAQVAGYQDLLYAAGELGTPTLSDGNTNGDAGNDLALVDGWLALGGRDMLLSGDNLASSLSATGSAGPAFLATRLGVAYVDADVRDDIDGQASPLVVKVTGNPVFTTAASWAVYGGCPVPNGFDRIQPLAGAVRLAQFTAPDGVSTPYDSAPVVLSVSGTSRLVTMDFDLGFVVEPAKAPSPMPARAVLLSNVLDYFQVGGDLIDPTDVPGTVSAFAVAARPNPFNPAVTLHYTLPRPGRVTIKIFDTRGALVRTLLDEDVRQTSDLVVWDGTDQRGEGVSSGLYFVETRADGQVDVRKVTMLK